jgi:hypothetical protein
MVSHAYHDDLITADHFHYGMIPSMEPKPKSNQTYGDEGNKSKTCLCRGRNLTIPDGVNENLTDEQLMISTKWVVGYALKTKSWSMSNGLLCLL